MNKKILNLAIPSIISNITVPLLGLVDTSITGHMGEARYIGAIAVGSMIFNVTYWLFGFLRMGTGGLTAQAYGREDMQEALTTGFRSLIISSIIGTLIILFQMPLLSFALWFIAPEQGVMSLTTLLRHLHLGCASHSRTLRPQRLVCGNAEYEDSDGYLYLTEYHKHTALPHFRLWLRHED